MVAHEKQAATRVFVSESFIACAVLLPIMTRRKRLRAGIVPLNIANVAMSFRSGLIPYGFHEYDEMPSSAAFNQRFHDQPQIRLLCGPLEDRLQAVSVTDGMSVRSSRIFCLAYLP